MSLPPLSGMKILDFSYLLPGPYATMLLADLGAEVIKIENFLSPDMVRYYPPFIDSVSAVYAQLNRGKKSLALNLKQPAAVETVRRLVASYDIVFEQFRPGVMDKLGLGYESLRKINPSIIYCSLTGYGQTGSYRDRAGHDINYLALSGIASFSGRRDTGPTLDGIQVADLCGGSQQAVIAILAATIKRMNTGTGEYIDIAITDGIFSLTAFAAAAALAGGPEPSAETELLNGATLYDYYRTADGRYIAVGPLEQKFVQSFCAAVGYPEATNDVLRDPSSLPDVKRRIAACIAEKPLAHWDGVFRKIDACVEKVSTLGEAIDGPPLAERGMIVTAVSPRGAEYRQVGNAFHFNSGHFHARQAGVQLGHHNAEILSSLGFTGAQIDRMRLEKAIPS